MSDGITLVLDRRNVHVRVEHRALRIEYADGSFRRYPPALLAQVMVHGNPAVCCDAWRLLAEHGVPVALFPGRGRSGAAWMGAGLATTVHHRQAQHRLVADPEQRLSVARKLVAAKISSCNQAAAALGAEPPSSLQDTLADCRTAATRSRLFGIEGIAARRWFEWLGERIAPHWQFTGRNRRPPRDPVNALLSLSYTLLTGLGVQQVEGAGLDPWLGFLHETAPARPALALDVVERFRPAVDGFVVSTLDRVLGPADFSDSERDGCRLRKEARARFYAAWAEWSYGWSPPGQGEDEHDVHGLRRALRREAEALRDGLVAAT